MSADIEKIWVTRAGFPAVATMIDNQYRCGYVGVSPLSPFHRLEYYEDNILLSDIYQSTLQKNSGTTNFPIAIDHVIEVHGGITYSGSLAYLEPKAYRGHWWFGFDCAHAGDMVYRANASTTLAVSVRTLNFVIEQSEKVADQLGALVPYDYRY